MEQDKLNKEFVEAEKFAELVSTVALTCLEGGEFDPLKLKRVGHLTV